MNLSRSRYALAMTAGTERAAPVGIIAALIAVGLLVDQRVPGWGQYAVDFVVWAAFIGWLARCSASTRLTLIVCVVWATAGELFLSCVWGLYDYRLHALPLFVPPGHALLFVVGTEFAKRAPDAIVWVVPAVAALPVIGLAWSGHDTMGLVFFAALLPCLIFSRGRKLYAVMFVVSLGLELYGTALGNWAWRPQAPLTGWSMTNPPLAAGTLYCILDLLVVTTMSAIGRARASSADAVSS